MKNNFSAPKNIALMNLFELQSEHILLFLKHILILFAPNVHFTILIRTTIAIKYE